MNRRTISTAVAVLAIAAALVSCSDDTPSTAAEVEAHWQCDVQRFAFDDLAALNSELESRIVAAGMTVDEYNDFKQQMSSSTELRLTVAEEYDRYCSG